MHVFRRFLRYYKPYRTVFWLDMACAMLVSVIDLVFPQLLNYLTRSVFTRSPQEVLSLLAPLALGLLVMYLVRYGGRFYITYQGHVMGARMESDMRQDLFDQFQRLSFSYYDRNNTGEMMSKLVSDLFDISELAHHGPENIFISLLKIFGSFVLLLWINVPMTLILLAVTLVMLAFSVWQNGKMRAVFMDNRRKIAGVNASLQDSLAGIRVVKSFANEDVERKKFSGSNLQFLDSKERNYKRMGIFHAGNNFFQGMLFLTVLVSGGYFIANGQIDAVDLATYALYINIFINPIEVLVEFTEMFQKGFSGFKRFLEVMDTEPEIVDAPDARPLRNVKGVIDYNDVSFSYERHETVLSHIQIHIDAGRTVALISDAGTPGISDPGFLLVRTCVEQGIEVETLPGATACIPALVQSGFPCDRFCFEGFLPQKKGRNKRLQELASEERTMVFYESPYRVVRCLEQFAEVFGPDRAVSVSRELTKKFEQTVRGSVAEVLGHFRATEPRGEFVIVVAGKPKSRNTDKL